MAAQSKKLRQGAEELLRRTGMAGSAGGGSATMPATGTGMGMSMGSGPMAPAFSHHAGGQQGGRGGSMLSAAHDLVPGHRHRGAERHSAAAGR